MAQGQEKEIKLLSTKAGRRKFFQLPLVKEKIIPGSRHTLDLWNQYLDTRDRKLTRSGMAYRIRRTNGKAFEATVKSQGKTVNGFSSREEYTVPLTKPEPVLQGFAPQLDQKLQTLLQEDELLPLCTVEFTRKTALIQLSAVTVVEAALDQGTLTAGDKKAPIEELELEIKRGQERDLLRFTAALAQAIPLWPEERSKFKRGLDLTGWKGNPPKDGKAPGWNQETEPSEVWRTLVQQALGRGLDLLVPGENREFESRELLTILQQCAGLWNLGQGFLSRTSWKKGRDLLDGLLGVLEPVDYLETSDRQREKPFPEELLSLEPAWQWLEDRWVAAAQHCADCCAREAGAALWQLLYLATLAKKDGENSTLEKFLQVRWNRWQQEQQFLEDAGSPDPWERKGQLEDLAGLLTLERGLGEKRLVKRGEAYWEQWWKYCRSYARTGALAEGAEGARDRELTLSLAALCGQEGIRTEKRGDKADAAGKAFFREVARHPEWSCLAKEK